jgi:hypothetical protein
MARNDRNRGNQGQKRGQSGQQQSGREQQSGGNRQGGNRGGGAKFELDNLTYNLITILHEKSKGLEAYSKYMQDAGQDSDVAQIFEEIRDDDRRHIQRLEAALREQLGGGMAGEEMEEEEEAA